MVTVFLLPRVGSLVLFTGALGAPTLWKRGVVFEIDGNRTGIFWETTGECHYPFLWFQVPQDGHYTVEVW